MQGRWTMNAQRFGLVVRCARRRGGGLWGEGGWACRTSIGSEFYRIVQADNAPSGIENHRGGNNGTEQRTTRGLINAGDAQPAQFARRSLETGGAESAHSLGVTPMQHQGNSWRF